MNFNNPISNKLEYQLFIQLDDQLSIKLYTKLHWQLVDQLNNQLENVFYLQLHTHLVYNQS